MIKKHAPHCGVITIACVAAFYGCGEDDASTHDELLSTEAVITALRAGDQETRAAAEACFDTFKTCRANAAQDEASCRAQLEECLPDRPMGSFCGDDDDDGDGGPGRGPRADGGVAPGAWGGDGGRPPRPDLGGGRGGRGAEADDHEECDGGRARPGDDGGALAAGRRGDKQRGPSVAGLRGGPGGAGRCGDDDDRFPRGALGGCRDRASSSMQGGMSTDGARGAHLACVAGAFEQILTKLCARASELCAQSGAPADVCTRIQDACSAFPASDAAAPAPRPDAGS